MGILEDKVYDFVMDNVDAANRAKANTLLNDAFDKRDDGELSLDEARRVMDELIGLARPEDQAELRRQLEQNRAVIEKYLAK